MNEIAIEELPQPDVVSRTDVLDRASRVLRPTAALRRLDEVAAWLASWQRTARPRVDAPSVFIFAADHGVAVHGVSAYPRSITVEMLAALRSGAATANVLARHSGARLEVVDVGVDRPTEDITVADAMDENRFRECFESGRSAVRAVDTDLVVVGEMGIGNTTAAAAVAGALFGSPTEEWVGRGTGIDENALARKIEAVERACRRVEGASPSEILRRAGGCELVAIAGAVLEARMHSLPVVLDGFVVTAAAAVLERARPGALDHCIAGHCSSEPGHRLLLEKLRLSPLLDLDLRLGEGSGALAAVPLVRLAAACVTEVATFEEWGIE